MGMNALGPFVQIGYLVDDMERSARHWLELTGIGPWTCFRNVLLQGSYRGQQTEVRIDVALAYQGGTQIELIKLHSRTPSPYADDNGQPIIGMHHIAWLSDDFERDISLATNRGLDVVFNATSNGLQVAYLASPREPGLLFELICGAGQREMIAGGIAESQRWDGCDPFRYPTLS